MSLAEKPQLEEVGPVPDLSFESLQQMTDSELGQALEGLPDEAISRWVKEIQDNKKVLDHQVAQSGQGYDYAEQLIKEKDELTELQVRLKKVLKARSQPAEVVIETPKAIVEDQQGYVPLRGIETMTDDEVRQAKNRLKKDITQARKDGRGSYAVEANRDLQYLTMREVELKRQPDAQVIPIEEVRGPEKIAKKENETRAERYRRVVTNAYIEKNDPRLGKVKDTIETSADRLTTQAETTPAQVPQKQSWAARVSSFARKFWSK